MGPSEYITEGGGLQISPNTNKKIKKMALNYKNRTQFKNNNNYNNNKNVRDYLDFAYPQREGHPYFAHHLEGFPHFADET